MTQGRLLKSASGGAAAASLAELSGWSQEVQTASPFLGEKAAWF